MWCFNLYVGPQRDLGVLCATNVTSHATHQHATTFCFFKTSGLRFKQTDKVHFKRGNIKHYCKNRKVDFLLFSKEHTSVHFFLQACTYSLEVHTYPLNFEYFLLFVKEHASVHSWPMATTIRLLELGQAINMKTIDNR